jgi:chromosomal replication initiator protein
LSTSDRGVVAALGRAIAQRIGEPRYNLWFVRKTKYVVNEGVLDVGVPNLFLQSFLQEQFADDVQAAAGEVLDGAVKVRFTMHPELFDSPAGHERDSQTGPDAPANRAVSPPKERRPAAAEPPTDVRNGSSSLTACGRPSRTRRWHGLIDFVVGPCNRVAHAAALSVVEAPGHGPNPLALHGPVGTGKTHLLEGIYGGLRKHHPDWRVIFVTAEDFTNRFVQAMQLSKLAAFRKHFRDCDALLLDDLQFLANKRATQEEFLHTFDVLHADGKPVVVTCDCHPRLTDQYLPELADRLLGGALWGLTPPDCETRLELLRAKATADRQTAIPEEVLRFLAQQLRGNVRELESALHSIRHLSRVTGRPVDRDLAREAVADLVRHAVRVVQLIDVDRAVCRVMRLDSGALQSRRRAWMVCHPRMLAMYLARKHTAATHSEIGAHFGKRNHSTAVAAEKKVRQWLEENVELLVGQKPVRARDLVELMERELTGR